MSYRYNCYLCNTKCDGKSIGIYNFDNDVEYSEYYENELINSIISLGFYAKKTIRQQYPDIEVYNKDGRLICFIEVKVQRRTFMRVQKYLPYSNLVPSETIALNQSDLEHYISQSKIETVPIYVMWVLSNRPCILNNNEVTFFYNKIKNLEKIFINYGEKRRFRRKSGQGDIVNGQHKGVVVNYHFSLNELIPFNLEVLLRNLC